MNPRRVLTHTLVLALTAPLTFVFSGCTLSQIVSLIPRGSASAASAPAMPGGSETPSSSATPNPTSSPTSTSTSTTGELSAYGAIAISKRSGAWGYTYGYESKAAAQKAAIKTCKKYSKGYSCTVVLNVVNQCAALATKVLSRSVRWAAATGATKAAAIAAAKKKAGSGAKVQGSFCSLP